MRTHADESAHSELDVDLNVAGEFEARFELTPERYQRKIRRLRITGWSMLATSIAGWVSVPFVARRQSSGASLAVRGFGWGTASLLALTCPVPLIRARVLVNRRRRWREAQGLSWDIRIRPGGLDWRLTF